MKWQQQNNGPWGSGGGNGGGPWGGGSGGGGRGGGGNPWGNGGGGGGGQPPDFEEMLRKSQERVKGFIPGGFGSGKGIALVVAILIFFWGLSGFYRVQPDEQGVELLFGQFVKTTQPGLNYWFPAPVGEVMKPKVTLTNQINVGFRGSATSRRDVPQESLMITGDQNIVDVDFVVQWRIRDAGDYLFNIREPEQTVKLAAESAMREIVGQTPFGLLMTNQRQDVAERTTTLLQGILDDYGAGITVLDVRMDKADPPGEVLDAFNDVQRAKQDQERLRNEALAYRNDILPRAQGEGARMVEEATAQKERQILETQGEAERFLAFYETYKAAPALTRERIYLETMQEVLGRSEKVLLDEDGGGSGVVPYLPLPEVQNRRRAAQGGN